MPRTLVVIETYDTWLLEFKKELELDRFSLPETLKKNLNLFWVVKNPCQDNILYILIKMLLRFV